jgi:capsular exopolysaccharide synthesis family protein
MAEPHLITLTDPRSAAAEAFRTLRTNLMLNEQALTTILVTAPSEEEDNNVIAANLAVTFAQAGNKTILVDGDLRKPSLHTLWGVSNETGLMTLIHDDRSLANPPLQPTAVPNLSLLTTGPLPPVPADILSSQRMHEIIGLLKARAHYVLFTSPPVLAASDAAVLGSKLDGAILVVRAGHTRREHTLRARQALERVRVRILGAVLSNAPRENNGYYG